MESSQGIRRRELLVGAAAVLAAAVASGGRAGATVAGAVAREVAPGLLIRPRDAWGARLPPKGPLAAETPRLLLVHHTATSNGYRPEDVVGRLGATYRWHTGKEKGWPDVAYNFFVDRFGGVWEGRAGSLTSAVRGESTGGNQGFSQLCCLVGDFASVLPSEKALDSLAKLVGWLAARYRIDLSAGATASFESRGSNRYPRGTRVVARTLSGHREMSQTTCPGDTLFAYLDVVRTRAHSYRQKLPPAS